ncbi:MAG: CoA pyrophosphatase [Thermoflexales bacterium]|nr:CoA pyrophosphatase [Thermoflexales bacterium]
MNLIPDVATIKQALAQPLPGLAAILPMLPPHRRADLARQLAPPTCRQAAALVLLYPHDGEWHLPLTRRTDSVETHKGQISLPGGAQEEGESFQETALREAHEELAVDPAQVEILGGLSPIYIPPSNFYLHPFVACAARRPAFRPLPGEVAELIETPLAALSDPANLREEDWLVQGQAARVPFYQLGSHKVWGATAMVLAELVVVLGKCAGLHIGD